MNVKRYTIAGGVSLAIHTAFLFVAQEPKVYAMPSGTQSNQVSINFKAVAQPQVEKPSTEVIEKEPKVEQSATQAAPLPAPDPQPKEVVKQPLLKEKPVKKKVAENPIKKTRKEKPAQKSAPKQTKPKPEPKPVIKEQVLKQKEPDKERMEKKPQEAPSKASINQGASSKPILVKKPSFLSKPSAPKYPRLARKRGIEGVALYEVWLDENGNQIKQVLLSSSGATMLDKSALAAIKKWRFSPHSVNGRHMAHRVQIPVRFKLD